MPGRDFTFDFEWADKGLAVSEVPVPAAVWLFGSGLVGLMGFKRRKKIAVENA